MPTPEENLAFAARLKQALTRSPKRIETATQLSIEFNLRHPTSSVSPQAAQKWLTGAGQPRPDKIRTLAEWLNVSELWLRTGVSDMKRPAPKRTEDRSEPPTPREFEVLRKLRSLSPYRRQLVLNVIDQFSLDGEIWNE